MFGEIIDNLELTHERLKQYLPARKRPFYANIQTKNTRGLLLYGPRGVGKTTFLLDATKDRNFLYLSADNPLISSLALYELVKNIFSRGYEGVVIDEIHYTNNWSRHLKSLYDDYPDRAIWVSDSSNLILKRAIADLSRRFVQYKMPMLSFREYLYLTADVYLDPVDIFNPDKSIITKLKDINVMRLFHNYLSEGMRPIFMEGEYCKRLMGILEKTIYSDIPFYVPSVQDNHLRLMNAIIGHLLISPVPTLNVSGMCSEWALSKEKLYNLLIAMEQSDLIRIVKKHGQPQTYSKGAKIFLSDPSFYFCFGGNKGTAREAFVVFSLSELYTITACKHELDCDYIIDGKKIEVGGRNKKAKDADYVIRDDIDLPYANKIPLWMVGLAF